MTAIRPTRYPKLVIAGVSVLTATLTALGANVVSYIKGDQAVQNVYHINVQTALTGTGAGANSSTLYDYIKYSGYKPLTATGGELKAEYQIANWDYIGSYTGVTLTASAPLMCIDVATAPTSNATYVDCNVQAASADTSSGTSIFNNLNLTVGSWCGGTGTTIGPNQQVVCYSSFGTGAGLVGDFNVMYRETELN